ncbi:carbohydrate binding domain-containing protein [Candidatus Sumerlaeota bacterium]|nr:carbohydrate binding domain-containing protein [Candidatus Sumerlaeota bacterium]
MKMIWRFVECQLVMALTISLVATFWPPGRAWAGEASSQANLKPFYLSWDNPPNAFANVSLTFDKPAGKHGPIAVRDGHLAFADGGRARFWGTNLSGEGNFPPKEIAERVADRLAKFGHNLVRFHGMDAWGRTIFDPKHKDTRHFDPEQLDRLDYLIAQLEKRGIYINLNLHVGRRFTQADGVAEADWLAYAKYCVIFDPRMIELQKEYARQLFTHRNAYTGMTYAEDPAVIIVELTNENSLLGGWTRGFLRGEQRSRPTNAWTDIPPHYGKLLTQLFNEWLVKRYGDRVALEKAWGKEASKGGAQLLVNGNFAADQKGWNLSLSKPAQAQLDIVRDGGEPSARVTVAKVTDSRWHIMLTQSGLKIRKGEKYAVRFRTKASSPRKITAEVAHQGAGGYRGYGSLTFDAPTDWSERRFTFVAPENDDSVRLSFQFGDAVGAAWLSGVEMAKAAIVGPRDDEDPAKGTVRRVAPEDFGGVTLARFRDEGRFLYETEMAYYKQMYDLLRNELKVKALVEGTNHNYGLPCLWAESSLDLMDCHAYWQHPSFPRRPWSRTDWTIGNSPMLDAPQRSTIAALCRSAVEGKPFTVSEYNHPFPNEYACESPLLMAAYGALQDWDAVYFYTFGHRWRENELSGNEVTGYFDVCNQVSQMAQMPVASLLFRQADVKPAERAVTISYDENRLFDSLREGGRDDAFRLERPLSPLLPLVHRFRVARFDAERTTRVEELGFVEPSEKIISDTGELVWNATGKGNGYFTVDSPRVQAAVGWIGGKTIETKQARVGTKTPFCAVSAIALDDKPLETSAKILVVAVARCENTGMEWTAERNSVGDRWGGPPILIEPVEGRLTLKRSAGAPALSFSPLDGSGLPQRQPQVISAEKSAITIQFRSVPATVWYALTAQR